MEGDIARLVERADESACCETRLRHCGRAAGIRTQIAVTKIARREKCSTAGQIKNNIAVRARIVTGRPELQGAARGRHRLSKIIDCDFERAEMTFCSPDPALRLRKIVDARRYDGCGRFDQDCDVEMILEQFAGLESRLVAAADQDNAA